MDDRCTPSFDVDCPVTYVSLLGRYVDDASLSQYSLFLMIESVMTVISKTYSSSSMTYQR